MVENGERAPGFGLPAVHSGELQRHSLSEHVGDSVVVLAFYPGDFGPLCDDTSSGLDDLDLFAMQKDTTILAISGDSVFSHRAFAEEYDLDMPLLADVHGEVAADYGVTADDDRYICRRAVFVVDNREQIEYSWVADDIETRPPADEIRAAIERIGDDRTALARYRVGHAHHIEGRRAFTSAMDAYEQREWMLATRDFAQATEEFDEAREEFNTAVRFSDDEEATRYFERAERKAEALWRAAGWLNDSAGAFASGEGSRGNELRDDAEGPLETARDIHKPPAPDEFPPAEDTQPEQRPRDSSADDGADLAVDTTDELVSTTASNDTEVTESPTDSETAAGGGATEADSAGTEGDTDDSAADIDEAELEAITAELEEQNESGGGDPSPSADEADEPADDDSDEEDIELELTDPTDDDDDDEDPLEDLGGDHGVPDSL